ncbi:acyl-CoA carboxylase subunit epsilon [Streptomyces sp. ISL-111]|uniref:acyl-CoA carboxylase subunit epsilon n=1 Tax=unclassified Streptomyces TaxID=2593676 RepID=UPI001BE96AE5|nr:acyl-CoA carboxylase subunit epsilon [Streptomyces sp. ISL-111]MBT2380612.1 acyl-CoA carboxylase subunit epsilon [Streptomyces sp. ISL-111]
MSTAAEQDGSLVRVVRGLPTPEELAAVVVVLTALPVPDTAGAGVPTRAPWRRAESPASSQVSWRAGR